MIKFFDHGICHPLSAAIYTPLKAYLSYYQEDCSASDAEPKIIAISKRSCAAALKQMRLRGWETSQQALWVPQGIACKGYQEFLTRTLNLSEKK